MFNQIHVYWFILPLIAAISLVYAASRHEAWRAIWMHAGQLSAMILGILVAINAVGLLILTFV